MSVLSRLGAFHDAVTRASTILSAICVLAIAVLYCSEVVTRYFLHSPTSWTAAVAIYLMLGSVALMMPYLVMADNHVAVTITDYLPQGMRRPLALGVLIVCVVICGLSTYISFEETARAFRRGVRTTDTLFVPKWWLLAPLVYGLGSSTIYFARQLATMLLVASPLRRETSDA